MDLPKVQVIRLIRNEIRLIPPDFLTSKTIFTLQELTLNSNNLQEIPEDIGNLRELQILGIAYNVELRELPRQIKDLEKLQFLNVTGNRIRDPH